MTAPAPASNPSKFKVWHESQYRNKSGVISRATSKHAAGMTFSSWDLGGCGLGSLFGFYSLGDNDLTLFADQADLMATLYRTLYHPGHVVYSLASHQLTDLKHLLLVEIGSTKIAEFPNLFHGPSNISLWLVNIRNAVGKYCDEYGEPYKVPSTKPWAIDPNPKPPANSMSAQLPTRK